MFLLCFLVWVIGFLLGYEVRFELGCGGYFGMECIVLGVIFVVMSLLFCLFGVGFSIYGSYWGCGGCIRFVG